METIGGEVLVDAIALVNDEPKVSVTEATVKEASAITTPTTITFPPLTPLANATESVFEQPKHPPLFCCTSVDEA